MFYVVGAVQVSSADFAKQLTLLLYILCTLLLQMDFGFIPRGKTLQTLNCHLGLKES